MLATYTICNCNLMLSSPLPDFIYLLKSVDYEIQSVLPLAQAHVLVETVVALHIQIVNKFTPLQYMQTICLNSHRKPSLTFVN